MDWLTILQRACVYCVCVCVYSLHSNPIFPTVLQRKCNRAAPTHPTIPQQFRATPTPTPPYHIYMSATPNHPTLPQQFRASPTHPTIPQYLSCHTHTHPTIPQIYACHTHTHPTLPQYICATPTPTHPTLPQYSRAAHTQPPPCHNIVVPHTHTPPYHNVIMPHVLNPPCHSLWLGQIETGDKEKEREKTNKYAGSGVHSTHQWIKGATLVPLKFRSHVRMQVLLCHAL